MGPNNDAAPIASAPEMKQIAKDIGVAFAREYYKGAVSGPDGVMKLYGNDSVYVDNDGKSFDGPQEIRSAILNLNLKEGKVLVISVSAALNGNDGILVQVIANFELESTKYAFSEAFCLARQAKGWYVRSSVFKWHDKIPSDADEVKSQEKDKPVMLNGNTKEAVVNGHMEKPKAVSSPKTSVAHKKSDDKTSTAPQKPNPPQQNHNVPLTVNASQAKPPVGDAKPAPPSAPPSWAAACVGNPNAKTNNVTTNIANKETTKKVNGDIKPTAAVAQVKDSKTMNGDASQGEVTKKQAKNARSQHTIHVSGVLKPGKTATENEVCGDLTEAFKEFGKVTQVRIPGRCLALDTHKLYCFVDFSEKEALDKIFDGKPLDEEGRVKFETSIPSLGFTGDIHIAQNRVSRFRNNRRGSENNQRPFGNRRSSDNRLSDNNRPPRNRRNSGNRAGQANNRRNNSSPNRNNSANATNNGHRRPFENNRRRDNGPIKTSNA